jgi:adenylosuccinate synthase
MKSITMVVDLQYGSTGKGLIAGWLAEHEMPDTIITAWAPNAGHTYISSRGRKFIHTHLANGIVSPMLRRVLLGPGSMVDPDQLLQEIADCRDVIGRARIAIHPHAAVVYQRHRDEEAGPMTKIGSTKKGVGAAAIERIRRDPHTANIAANEPRLKEFLVSTKEYSDLLAEADHVLIEGAQGYGLSMYHGFYPYTTSRDVSTWQILADCGIPASAVLGSGAAFTGRLNVVGTARTYPIRVANRFDDEGTQVGYSGPCYDDQKEISFGDIGQEVELTTVTKLPRRIFTFSEKQIGEAVRYCGATHTFLNFINYVKTKDEMYGIIDRLESSGTIIHWVGTGPTHDDVHLTNHLGRTMRIEAIMDIWSTKCCK